MKKRVIVVHCWAGAPDTRWYPWLADELSRKGFDVYVPEMPDTNEPKIESWVKKLAETVGTPDENVILVGHSIGCQTIMRYLDSNAEAHIAGAVFIAPWLTLQNLEDEESEKIAKPWLETGIDFEHVKNAADSFTAIFSDNDPFVNEENQKMFKEKLGAKIIVEHGKGHFTEDDGIAELPAALDAVLPFAKP